jgi:hypothetical protein
MTHPFLALSLGFGGVILATQIAFSQPQCDARDRVVALLAERYGETRHALGLAGEAAVMELFAAEATGTWTVTVTLPDGQMCLVASGSDFQTMTEELPATGPRI